MYVNHTHAENQRLVWVVEWNMGLQQDQVLLTAESPLQSCWSRFLKRSYFL